ncbi:outer membrane efflux protein [Caballeronia pedi]|uniref:Outer membrane efflux protein n=1 Tax=Caballeronia pedi TaxID=1777141 RepID=A0A158A156_9BURK|nr:outer membrane efflux protein [Caballeronia pedi]
MKFFKRSGKASFVLTALLLTACATHRSAKPAPVELPAKWTAATVIDGAHVGVDWWQEFDDQRLDRLVRRVLESNTDVLTAANRLRKARLEAASVATNMTPDVSLRAGVDWSTDPDAARRMRSGGGGVTAALSYDLDIGGKLAAERDSANGNVNRVESDGDWTRLKMVKESLEKYWKLGFLSESLNFAGESLAHAKKTLAIVQARYRAGDVSEIDVVAAQQKVIADGIAIDKLNEQVLKNRNALAILMGNPPETPVEIPDRLSSIPLKPVAAGLPADVIHRRADVRAAEWLLRQTLSQIDIARARLYPSLTLTGSVGTSSVNLERFLSNPIANLGLAVALPFFQWNQTQLQIKVSQAEFDAAAQAFRKTVYVALREVEDELTISAELAREETQLLEKLETARKAAHLAKVRFFAGQTAVQPWLQTQQSFTEAKEALAQIHLDRLTNRAALLVALGGSMENTTAIDREASGAYDCRQSSRG